MVGTTATADDPLSETLDPAPTSPPTTSAPDITGRTLDLARACQAATEARPCEQGSGAGPDFRDFLAAQRPVCADLEPAVQPIIDRQGTPLEQPDPIYMPSGELLLEDRYGFSMQCNWWMSSANEPHNVVLLSVGISPTPPGSATRSEPCAGSDTDCRTSTVDGSPIVVTANDEGAGSFLGDARLPTNWQLTIHASYGEDQGGVLKNPTRDRPPTGMLDAFEEATRKLVELTIGGTAWTEGALAESTAAPPTTTASNTDLCSLGSLAGLKPDGFTLKSVYFCDGTWAVVLASDDISAKPVIGERVGDQWARVDRQSACTARRDEAPSEVYEFACLAG